MQHSYRWRSRPQVSQLEQNIERLRSELIKLRRALTNKSGYATKLELVLHQRLETIDELNGRLQQSREQIRQLDLANEVLTAMIAAPQLDADRLHQRNKSFIE
jgi:hypothetical protein